MQLVVESLPYAPVTEVRLEEKTKASADTKATPKDINDVIELPDVPTKVLERPEAPEKKQRFRSRVIIPFYIFIRYPFLVYMVH